MEKISVIMSTYNEEPVWLHESIKSILNQTYTNIEFIIVNDNPENLILKGILNKYSDLDSRVKIIENESNIGLVKSLNRALENVTGQYIARMDADDISEFCRLSKQKKYLDENTDIDFIGADMVFIDEVGEKTNNKSSIITNHEIIKRNLSYGNTFNHPTWFFRREILDVIRSYNNIKYVEDYEFVCRILLAGFKCANIDEKLVKYRVRYNGICKSNQLIQHRVQYKLGKLYKDALDGKEFNVNKVSKVNVSENEEKKFEKYCSKIEEFTKNKSLRSIVYLTLMSVVSTDNRVRLAAKIRKEYNIFKINKERKRLLNNFNK